MALTIFHHQNTQNLTVISGYESGHTTISSLSNHNNNTSTKTWKTIYVAQAHSQPILSLALATLQDFYITSSADSIIAKHPIPTISVAGADVENSPIKTVNTKHSGQQSLQIRSDSKIFATAGWDSRIRVYAVKGMKEVAVLKWHKEGCYSVAFAEFVGEEGGKGDEGEREGVAWNKEVAGRAEEKGGEKALVKNLVGMTVKEQRIKKASETHWLVAGSKDGKISLWDIY